MENLSGGFEKKQQKTHVHMKWLSFITQFKILLLLSFTSCRKVLGKMPVQVINFLIQQWFLIQLPLYLVMVTWNTVKNHTAKNGPLMWKGGIQFQFF